MSANRSKLAIAGRLFMAGAAGVSLYLSSIALGRTPLPGCAIDSGCYHVLHSRWAFAFGIPVSFLGFVLYSLAVLQSWAFSSRQRTAAGFGGAIAIAAAAAGAAWFSGLQVLELESQCVWCWITHTMAATGALLLCRAASTQRAVDAPGTQGLRARQCWSGPAPIAISLAGIAVLAIGAADRDPAVTEPAVRIAEANIAAMNNVRRQGPEGPSIAIARSGVELGAVEPGVPREFNVAVKNDGTMPLALHWLALDHGCEITSLPEKDIAPGTTASIGLRVTPSTGSADFRRTIRIFSNASEDPAEVTVSGFTSAQMAAEAGSSQPAPSPSNSNSDSNS